MANEKRLIDATRLEYWIDGVIHGAEVNGNAPTVNLYDVLTYLDGMPTVDAPAEADERRMRMKCAECPEFKECHKQHNLTIKRKHCVKAKEEKLPSRADRIRAMTDEELAAKLIFWDDDRDRWETDAGYIEGDPRKTREKAIQAELAWLRQPAEEVE